MAQKIVKPVRVRIGNIVSHYYGKEGTVERSAWNSKDGLLPVLLDVELSRIVGKPRTMILFRRDLIKLV